MNNTPENGNIINIQTTDTVSAPTVPKKNYTLTHAIFALLTLVLGTLWYRWVFLYDSPDIFGTYRALPITVFALVFFALTLTFFKVRKAKIGVDALIMMVSSLVFSLRFAIYPKDTSSTIFVLSLMVLHISVLLFLRCIARENALDSIVGETAMAVLVEPFACFHTLPASFSAFFKINKSTEESKEKAKKASYEFGLVLLGIFITIPLVFIVLSLLNSDEFFNSFLKDAFDFLGNLSFDFRIGNYLNIITILVSLFIYGAIYSADKKRCEEKPLPQSFAFLPATIINTVNIVLLGVYLLFVIAQINGFAHMFTGRLPEGETYADFARSGFFELCSVACINGAVLFYSKLFCIPNLEGKRRNILPFTVIGFTLFLIFTAAFKMSMYISAYGFTPKRFYTLWFMLLLAILFVMTIIKYLKPKFKLSRYSVYTCLVMLTILFLVDFQSISSTINATYGWV